MVCPASNKKLTSSTAFLYVFTFCFLYLFYYFICTAKAFTQLNDILHNFSILSNSLQATSEKMRSLHVAAQKTLGEVQGLDVLASTNISQTASDKSQSDQAKTAKAYDLSLWECIEWIEGISRLYSLESSRKAALLTQAYQALSSSNILIPVGGTEVADRAKKYPGVTASAIETLASEWHSQSFENSSKQVKELFQKLSLST